MNATDGLAGQIALGVMLTFCLGLFLLAVPAVARWLGRRIRSRIAARLEARALLTIRRRIAGRLNR